ncbi:MAG: amidase, partial [Aquincola sp.]|nr:amidase [Aquincola sp.]
MTLDEYSSYDALGLAELVRRGEVSASELAELARRAIAATNPALNFLAGAIDEAGVGERDASAPFAGVPFLLKDLGAHVANVPIEYGSRIARGVKFEQDSELAARYRRSGVVFVGRTTTPEFGLSPTTESSLHGVTSNPWNTALSPGGSSGGSAAAVAAGVVPMAHAADGMGSIRIPAHYCGLFGLKPSRGRLPKGPSWAGLGDLSTSHVISRSVRDSAAMLDASACAEPGSSYWLQAPARPFLRELDAEPPKLRIGMTSTLPVGGGQPDAETLQA